MEISMKFRELSDEQWKFMGYSKGTLHNMEQNANADKRFTLNAHARRKPI